MRELPRITVRSGRKEEIRRRYGDNLAQLRFKDYSLFEGIDFILQDAWFGTLCVRGSLEYLHRFLDKRGIEIEADPKTARYYISFADETI